ncbi:hypothetical protein GCM10019060_28890 [Novosphingobium pokkalii]|nr:hypothetical protein GCM10019060_28890 [Novosphingobium pokkalii]
MRSRWLRLPLATRQARGASREPGTWLGQGFRGRGSLDPWSGSFVSAAPARSPTRPPNDSTLWEAGPLSENVPRTFSVPSGRERAGAAVKMRLGAFSKLRVTAS